MTTEQEQLEAQSRAAIKAWCDDPSVQLERKNKFYHGSEWMQNTDLIFNPRQYYYSIAKPKKWYRVAKFKNGLPFLIWEDEEFWRNHPQFDCWLDERKEYE